MTPRELLSILSVAEKLKCTTRHCDTSSGRRESVAEHSWRLAFMAFLLKDEFPEADMDKVLRMCLVHDLGEAFTGDVAVFRKTDKDDKAEEDAFREWIASFPSPRKEEMQALLDEMTERKTLEAKIFKSLDQLEAVIQHNESDIRTWLPLEYDLQLTHGAENVRCHPYLTELKKEIDAWTRRKIDDGC